MAVVRALGRPRAAQSGAARSVRSWGAGRPGQQRRSAGTRRVVNPRRCSSRRRSGRDLHCVVPSASGGSPRPAVDRPFHIRAVPVVHMAGAGTAGLAARAGRDVCHRSDRCGDSVFHLAAARIVRLDRAHVRGFVLRHDTGPVWTPPARGQLPARTADAEPRRPSWLRRRRRNRRGRARGGHAGRARPAPECRPTPSRRSAPPTLAPRGRRGQRLRERPHERTATLLSRDPALSARLHSPWNVMRSLMPKRTARRSRLVCSAPSPAMSSVAARDGSRLVANAIAWMRSIGRFFATSRVTATSRTPLETCGAVDQSRSSIPFAIGMTDRPDARPTSDAVAPETAVTSVARLANARSTTGGAQEHRQGAQQRVHRQHGQGSTGVRRPGQLRLQASRTSRARGRCQAGACAGDPRSRCTFRRSGTAMSPSIGTSTCSTLRPACGKPTGAGVVVSTRTSWCRAARAVARSETCDSTPPMRGGHQSVAKTIRTWVLRQRQARRLPTTDAVAGASGRGTIRWPGRSLV